MDVTIPRPTLPSGPLGGGWRTRRVLAGRSRAAARSAPGSDARRAACLPGHAARCVPAVRSGSCPCARPGALSTFSKRCFIRTPVWTRSTTKDGSLTVGHGQARKKVLLRQVVHPAVHTYCSGRRRDQCGGGQHTCNARMDSGGRRVGLARAGRLACQLGWRLCFLPSADPTNAAMAIHVSGGDRVEGYRVPKKIRSGLDVHATRARSDADSRRWRCWEREVSQAERPSRGRAR